jgi:cytidylate kinase
MAVITVSRGSMSGGEALARSLGERLGHPVISREVLVEAASQIGVSEEMLAQKVSHSPGVWERLTSNRRIYLAAVQAALAERILDGNLVYHGHAGHLLLGGLAGVLCVRLIAPLEMRIKTVMERQSLDRQAAEDYVRDVDNERARWTKMIYGVDWSDPSLYDVVINLAKMSPDTACAAVAEIARRPEFASTGALRATLADFRLQCRVKLALATNQRTRDMVFEIGAAEGVITLEGRLPPAGLVGQIEVRDEQDVLATVFSVKGVTDVRWPH